MPKNELNGSALLDDVSFDNLKPASATRTVDLEDTTHTSDGAAMRPAAASESSGDSESLTRSSSD